MAINVIRRLTHLDSHTKINFLLYPFFMTTLSYGIGFVLFGGTEFVHKSSLFVAMASLHPWIPYIWGIAAILAVVTGFVLIIYRKHISVGGTSALFGCLVWIFAGFCYALTGGWLLDFAIAAPNLMFWIWYYFRLSHFRRYGIPNPDIDRVIE